MIGNPVYCGKIIMPAYKNEPMHWVEGKHEGLVTEKIFRQVQLVLKNRKGKNIKIKRTTPPELYLRGFLACLKCNRMLTGSRSKGRHDVYYYYHCQSSCGFRYRASLANAFFEKEISRWKIKKCFSQLYAVILSEHSHIYRNSKQDSYDLSQKNIEKQKLKLKRARDLYIDGDMDANEFRQVKAEYTYRIKQLQELILSNPRMLKDQKASATDKQFTIMSLLDFFKKADTSQKRSLVSFMFPGKLIFDKAAFQIKQYSVVSQLIFKR